MRRPAPLSEAVIEPRFFTELTVRRHRRELERSPEFLFKMEEGQARPVFVRQPSEPGEVVLPEPPEMVRHFFTQLEAWIRAKGAIAQMERPAVACLPSALAWLDRIDPSAYEQASHQEFQRNRSSGNVLWNVWLESERYIVETDAYVTKRLGDDTTLLSNGIQRDIDHLWLRRYFYRILVGRQIEDRYCLPETEWRYLTEQLWATAHAAAGLMFGSLHEAVVPSSEATDGANTFLPVISGEDRRWLSDAANDVVA